MQYLSAFTAIADVLDMTPNTLTKFHLPYGTILQYIELIKELYKKLLKMHTLTHSENLQPFFQHVDLLFSVLLSAGGDTIIRPRVEEYNDTVKHAFEDIVTENSISILLGQIVWIIRRIGKTFVIAPMESLKID